MSKNDFNSFHAAAHVAQFNHAQPVAPRLLTLDERIDQLKAALLAAKAQDNTAEIERLWIVWQQLSAEIEAEEVTSAAVADVLDGLTAAADQVRSEAASEWATALDAGWSWLLEQDAISVDAHGALLVPSSRNPETIYRANGSCQCEAFITSRTPRPCYHRAAGLIVERWRENTTVDTYAEQWA